MFGRRPRPPNPQPLTTVTANPTAATAAALSAAAAAAALRARPTTPTRVADVQTKRTLRRSASIASAASSDAQGRPGLQRRGSSSSMAERTLRSPSPHQRSSGNAPLQRQSHSASYTTSEEMPPVPELPSDMGSNVRQSDTGAHRESSHRKTNSLGLSVTPLRLASQQLASKDAASWFGGAKVGDPRNVRRTDPAMASPPSSPPRVYQEEQVGDGARPSSRASSINFSYPGRARVGSPPVSPTDNRIPFDSPNRSDTQQGRQVYQARQPKQVKQSPKPHLTAGSGGSSTAARSRSQSSEQAMVYDPNSRRMVRQADLRAVEEAVTEASQRVTHSKAKKQLNQRAGSHLAKGTIARSRSSASNAGQERQIQVPNLAPQTRPRASEELPRAKEAQEDFEEPAIKAIISSPRIEAKRMEQHRAPDHSLLSLTVESLAAPVPQAIRRQPSVVREESEPELVPGNYTQRVISDALDAVPARLRLYTETGSEALQDEGNSQWPSPLSNSAHSSPQPLGFVQNPAEAKKVEAAKPQSFHSQNPADILRERTHSNSPVRQAHFGPVSSSLTVKHSPPARSISPRKSALKQTSPSRGASPSEESSEASANVILREEPPVTRKKLVRVSFDDGGTVVVGESPSTNQTESLVLPSPQDTAGRRPWYGNIGRGKKELPPLDDDEIMKPRPALPSFGSVRDKKPRETIPDEGERPLVRPIGDITYSAPLTKHPKVAEESGAAVGFLGQSNDHAVGSVLAREHEEKSKIPANISRFREPLPPVVTTVEGSGYNSDSSSDSELEDTETEHLREVVGVAERQSGVAKSPEAPTSSSNVDNAIPVEVAHEDGRIPNTSLPTISISQSAPPVTGKTPEPYFEVPGGFPEDDSDLSAPDVHQVATLPTSEVKLNTGNRVTSAEIVATHHTPAIPQPTPLAGAESPSDSESSIYSDAYEDLSELDGDGFQSLDAVVESPVSPGGLVDSLHRQRTSSKLSQENAPVPETKAPRPATPVDTQPAVPSQDEWEQAKAFWRSLTADKRAQLEKEALEDAGIEGDREEASPSQKPKKKKSVERRTSERKALAVHLAQQIIAQQQKEGAPQSERSYMIKPGTVWADAEVDAPTPTMRTTLRGPRQQAAPTSGSGGAHLRKSMRPNGSTTNNIEPVRPSWARHSDVKPKHPASTPLPPQTAAVSRRKAESRTEPAPPNPTHFPPAISRRDSTGSESSFKRSRVAPGGQASGFRQSMRYASPLSTRAEKRSSKRFSLRSLSPSGSFGRSTDLPPVSLTASSQMRQSLRDSSSERKRSPPRMRIPTFGLSTGTKKAGKKTSGSGFSSRFGESSDEGGGGATPGFRSRFEDSSDDEVISAIALTKTLPLPRAATVGHVRSQQSVASTALPEELEESEELPDTNTGGKQRNQSNPDSPAIQPSPGKLVPSQTAPIIGTTTTAVTAERRNSTASKRSSFMSALRRKKGDSAGKISRPAIAESAARRDTKLERNLSQLRSIRDAGIEAEAEEDAEEIKAEKGPPRSPKLQKRVVSLARSVGSTNTGQEGEWPSPLALASAPTITATTPVPVPAPEFVASNAGEKNAGFPSGLVGEDEKGFIASLRRPSTSGNLGTRTMSGGALTQGQYQQQTPPGFLQRRTLSSGVMSADAGSVAGTGTSTTTKKKKFGALRRMFGLDE
ncbi:hypothetical protein B0H67DRAFT_677795 [Lasiosphaeris hirsuta]|uniref:Uncharacterized protein n=1 Tax=Lasiosphaeris hirsuta TaxID=260670 RepID=A0AA40B907_9PEZI|nr:hypothetical protein B0H67DRAFT_677795 [Lasiosphaeris hirsuta]